MKKITIYELVDLNATTLNYEIARICSARLKCLAIMIRYTAADTAKTAYKRAQCLGVPD